MVDAVDESGRHLGGCVLAAQAGVLEQFAHSLEERLGDKPQRIVTGGVALTLVEGMGIDCVLDPLLVFHGMLVD